MIQLCSAALLSLATLSASVDPEPGRRSTELRQEDAWTQEQLEEVTARIKGDIEAIRERSFERPVAVHTTDRPGFLRYAKARLEAMISAEEMLIETELAKLLFLVPPEMDLWGTTLEVLEEQVGGFYDPQTEAFYLMESFTGKVAEIIIAHELTHALDDQLFGIDQGLEATEDNGDASQAYSSIVEGSGTIVMARWTMDHMGELSMEDLAAAGDLGTDSLAEAPPFVWKPLLSSYLSGQAFLQRGYRLRKKQKKTLTDVIEEAFENPPASTEQILHPDKYWKESKRDLPRVVVQEAGELPDGWELRAERVLGELVLSMVAASSKEREPIDMDNQLAMALLKFTNKAAEGWGGDSLMLLSKGDARVAHVVTVWDSAKDADEFGEAIEALLPQWTEAMAVLDTEGLGQGVRVAHSHGSEVVAFTSWYGAPEAEVQSVLAGLSWHEGVDDVTAATKGD